MNESARPKRKFALRFGLRTLLALLTIVSIWFAWRTHRARQLRQIVESIQADGYKVYYSLENPTQHAFADETWIGRILGVKSYAGVVGVEGFSIPNIGSDRLHALARMNSLESLRISSMEVDEETFKAIGEMSTLRILHLSCPDFPHDQLNHLAKLNNLEEISITRPIGDGGVAILAQIRSLKNIRISSDTLTQKGIQQLAALKHLKRVRLSGNLDVSGETQQAMGKVTLDDGSFQRRMQFPTPLAPPVIFQNADFDQSDRDKTEWQLLRGDY